MTPTLVRNPATERQVSYLVSLWERWADRVQQIDPDNGAEAALVIHEAIADVTEGRRVLSKSDASGLIDSLKAKLAANRVVEAVVPSVTEGLYLRDDVVFKVVRSQRGNLYAKRLVPGGRRGRFEYAPAAVGQLTAADALTPERAAEWGHQAREGHDGEIRVYCACCGAELDTQESRDRGIGPVCFDRHFA